MEKKGIFIIVLLLILIPIISAEDFGYNYLEGELNVAQAINYSQVNVNNSQYFQDYTPSTLGSWLETTFGWITNAVNDLVNYYTKTEIETNYVPYTGANANVDLGGYNITASWFKGLFNWTTGDTWNIFNGYNLTFNESKLSSTYINPTQSEFITGTLDGGTLADVQHSDAAYDDITFNFSEESGSPALDLRINFTGVDNFNRGIMRYKTSSLAGDYPIIEMWNYDRGIWEHYPSVGESDIFVTITQPVFDWSDHIQDGVAQMRIYKSSNGNTNNHYYVDWIALVSGYGLPSGQEVDPYSFHKNENINMTNYNITNINYLKLTNTTTTWNMYVDVNGTLVWEQE